MRINTCLCLFLGVKVSHLVDLILSDLATRDSLVQGFISLLKFSFKSLYYRVLFLYSLLYVLGSLNVSFKVLVLLLSMVLFYLFSQVVYDFVFGCKLIHLFTNSLLMLCYLVPIFLNSGLLFLQANNHLVIFISVNFIQSLLTSFMLSHFRPTLGLFDLNH